MDVVKHKEAPRITLKKDGSVLYNGVNIGENVTEIKADITSGLTTVNITFHSVIFESEGLATAIKLDTVPLQRA